MDSVDADLQEWYAEHPLPSVADEPAEAAAAPAAETTTPPPATPEAVTEPAAQPPQKPRYRLDDIVLDDDDLPPTLRGKTAKELDAERRKAAADRDQANYQLKQLQTERDMAFKALEKTLERVGQPPAPPPPEAPRPGDRLRKRGVEGTSALLTHTDDVLAATVEAGAEEAMDRFRPEFETVQQRVERLEKQEAEREETARRDSWRRAHQAARPQDVTPDKWEAAIEVISGPVLAMGLPLDRPESYQKAWQWLTQNGFSIAGAAPPVPSSQPPTPAPPTTAATAPPPPAGGGKPTVPAASKPSAHLNNHQREAFAQVTNVFKKVGMDLSIDDVLDDVRKDPRTEKVFP